MKRWMRLAARLYPRGWRERYSEEFDALIEDYHPSWREFADVVRGAVKMQIRMGRGYLKIVGAMAALGAIVAGAASFRVAPMYVSTAVVRLPAREIGPIERKIGSRTFLTYLFSGSRLPLDPHITMDEALQGLRKDLQIRQTGEGLAISFAYPDGAKARAVVAKLASEAVGTSDMIDRVHTLEWQELWPRTTPPTPRQTAHILTPASVPKKLAGPNRLAYTAVGCAAGVLVGGLVALVRRHSKRVLTLAGYAVAGAVVATAIAFTIPDRFTSTATLLLSPPLFPDRPSGHVLADSAATIFARVRQETFSPSSLAKIVQDPRMDLYGKERAKRQLAEVVERMRTRDLVVRDLGSANSSLQGIAISFTYPDRYKARRVVQELLTSLVNGCYEQQRAAVAGLKPDDELAVLMDRRMGENLEVLDPASLPAVPVGPNRMIFAAGGMGLGLLAGALFARRRAALKLQTA